MASPSVEHNALKIYPSWAREGERESEKGQDNYSS